MNRLKTTGVVGGAVAWTAGWRSGARSENSRKRGYQRAFAAITATAVVMSLMVVLASPALAHHPILSVSAVCDQGNKVVTWTVANGNWEGRTMTVDLVEYTDGTSGWSSIVVGISLGPDAAASQSITYPLSETGTKTLTVRADWSGGSQDVKASLSTNLKDLKCKDHDTTTTTVKDKDTTTTTVKDKDTTTTTVKDSTTTTDKDSTTSSSTTSSSTTSSSSTSSSTTSSSSTSSSTTSSSTTSSSVTSSTIVTGVPTTDPNVTGSTVDDQVQGTVITTSSTVADEVDAVEILPFTGSNPEAMLVLALSVVALGGILVMSARREDG